MEAVWTFIQMEWVFLVLLILALALLVVLCIVGVVVWYHSTGYYKMTKHSTFSVLQDPFGDEDEKFTADKLGRYGEFLISLQLRSFEKRGAKLLYNTYIPKTDGTTTEIDVMMISPKGIFVFESKNYSGWIFGKESEKNWCQSLPKGKGRSKKEFFYNPIRQNASHIKHLSAFLGEDIPTKSLIVFSNRCKLKKITVNSDIPVVHRQDVRETVSRIYRKMPSVLSEEAVESLYQKLYPLTQASEIVEQQHIENINAGKKPSTLKQPKPQPKQPEPEVTPEEAPKEETPSQTDDRTCPDCGGRLKLRATKRGDRAGIAFLGCENYPECRYIREVKCPDCGGNLKLRTAKRGEKAGTQFYGCENFPKCRYIQPLEP